MASLKAASQSATVFRLWGSQAENAYDNLLVELHNQIVLLRSLGLSEEEIFTRLSAWLDSQTDLFGKFNGEIEKATDGLVSTIGQLESNGVFEGLDDLLEWVLDPTAQEHCETCLTNADMEPKPFAEWRDMGIPGAGNTDCGKYCKCSLEKAEVEVGVG